MLEERQNQLIEFAEIMKKKKGGEDRISALPDCLLLEILSRLPSTQDAIRTGALSKRWQHLWTLVPTLIFTSLFAWCPNQESDFVLSVDKTLTQCRQLKLKKFEVWTCYNILFKSQFKNWIRFAISCNVEELNFGFWRSEGEFVVDQFLFINSCFTDLTLAECKLNPSGAISWKNLRSLCISYGNLDEELLVNIVSGSPLLETLVLNCCEWPDIDKSKSESDIIQISASTSLSLTQCRQLKQLKKFQLLTFNVQFNPQISNFICYVIRCNVKELNLEFWDMYEYEFMRDQVLFTSSCFTKLTLEGCKLNPVGAISWKSLRTLCLSHYMKLDEDLIQKILSGSPVLETLELNRCYGFRRLDITSKSVKNLVLYGYKVPYRKSVIEINAPHIFSLKIEYGTFLCKPLLLNVSSLLKAYLNYTFTNFGYLPETPKEEEQEMLKEFIMSLRHVKELKLGSLCAEALSLLQAKGFVPLSNVKLA